MRLYKDLLKCRILMVLLYAFYCIMILTGDPNVQSWYSGMWDSSIYSRSDKPKTVALRIKIVNSKTGMAVSGANVELSGIWLEEWIGEVGSSYVPQEREFKMSATSGIEGVVVFALSWGKEYPWLFGRPETRIDKRGNVTFYDAHTSWVREIDEIEKVHQIDIRHYDFKSLKIEFDFSNLLEFGQDKKNESQEPQIFEEFENAWHEEIKKPDVKYCVLNLGTDFTEFGKKHCTRQEFFVKIRQQDFGTVYREPYNYFSYGEYPQSECGPYFIYLLQFAL
jgi:hypothetical protein